MADSPAQLPFQEAIDFFSKKIKLPSSGWTDIWEQQHSHAFVIAGATQDALLEDMYNALRKAMTTGTGYAEFHKYFLSTVNKHGWSYNGAPNWRSRVIYDTNITQSYNAGRYQQMMAVKHLRPFWRYRHTSMEHPRLTHKAWNGLTLSADDPWWNSHMPQNGWGCKCRVESLSRTEAEREWQKAGKTGPDMAPPIEYEERVVGKNGSNPRTVLTPKGIDPGFGYNPGQAYLEPLTVPPLTGYDAVLKERGAAWPTGFTPPTMPKATKVPASAVLPADTAPEVAVQDFLEVFGATMERGSVFTDAAGVSVAITKALFQDGTGTFKWLDKPEKIDRLRYVNLLASALIDPDEIWWNWEEDRQHSNDNPESFKRWRLKRRYLKVFEIEDTGEFAIVSFEWGRIGWNGSTAFLAEPSSAKARLKYFDKQRIGRLVYEKQK